MHTPWAIPTRPFYPARLALIQPMQNPWISWELVVFSLWPIPRAPCGLAASVTVRILIALFGCPRASRCRTHGLFQTFAPSFSEGFQGAGACTTHGLPWSLSFSFRADTLPRSLSFSIRSDANLLSQWVANEQPGAQPMGYARQSCHSISKAFQAPRACTTHWLLRQVRLGCAVCACNSGRYCRAIAAREAAFPLVWLSSFSG